MKPLTLLQRDYLVVIVKSQLFRLTTLRRKDILLLLNGI